MCSSDLAATQVSGSDIEPLGNGSDAMGAIGSPSPASEESEGLIVQGEALEVSTMTEESTEAYTTVYKETTALAEGETKVETAGVNGVSRTTYQVTSQGGTEISREAISAVIVSARVDDYLELQFDSLAKSIRWDWPPHSFPIHSS